MQWGKKKNQSKCINTTTTIRASQSEGNLLSVLFFHISTCHPITRGLFFFSIRLKPRLPLSAFTIFLQHWWMGVSVCVCETNDAKCRRPSKKIRADKSRPPWSTSVAHIGDHTTVSAGESRLCRRRSSKQNKTKNTDSTSWSDLQGSAAELHHGDASADLSSSSSSSVKKGQPDSKSNNVFPLKKTGNHRVILLHLRQRC